MGRRRIDRGRGSRIPLRVFRSRLARCCQHKTARLIPAGGDELALVCTGCGLVLDSLERTETTDS